MTDKNLWVELDNAVCLGLIRKMEGVSKASVDRPHHLRIIGTKIWFSSCVSNEQIVELSKYIKQKYNLVVDDELLSITIWHPIKYSLY